MATVTVPSQELLDVVGDVEGVDIHVWDLVGEPPIDDIDLAILRYPMNPADKAALSKPSRIGTVQVLSAGYDHVLGAIPAGSRLANGRGIHTTATAEDALCLMLAAQRRIPEMVAFQQQGVWGRFDDMPAGLADRTVAIAGYGDIGRAIAQRLVACEAIPTGFATTARAGDEFVAEVRPLGELLADPSRFEIIVLVMPLTDATRNTVDADFLRRCAPGTLIVNVGRGGLIDTTALLDSLHEGHVRAALDVTDPEPLPAGHPLFSAPNTIVFPHVGGLSQAQTPRMHAFVKDQVARLARGEELRNLVPSQEGTPMIPTHHEDSILVNTTPDVLYAMVSDVTRHGEWSGQAQTCEWVDPGHTGLGASFHGHNHDEQRGDWTTTSTVVEAEPGRRFAWQVGGGIVTWGFTMTPVDGETRLTETWDFDVDFTRAVFLDRYQDAAEAERQLCIREQNAATCMGPTLARIKEIAER